MLRESVAERQAAGLLGSRHPRHLALTAWPLVHGLAMLRLGGHLAPDDEVADDRTLVTALTDVLWEGPGEGAG